MEYHVVLCTKYAYGALYGNIAEKCVRVIKEVCSVNYIEYTQ
ncbi:MAG: transposase [Alphaproteobacteria bacterium]|nr:transposase [Alphaproteobacteria bacterium]